MMLSRLAAVFAAFALLASPTAARTPLRPEQPTAIEPALFVARDSDSTLYLFGAVHVRRPGTQWGGANAQAALASAEEVWTEIEISPNADAQAQSLVAQHGMQPPGQTLSSLLTAEENERFVALTQRLGVPAASFQQMRPWLAAITLSVLPMMQAGYDPQSGVDRSIDAFADANSKRMRWFESMEQQIGFPAGLSPEMQRQMLVETIAETEKGPSQLDAMSRAWETADLETLERLVVDETREGYPELYQSLFVQRNNAWMNVLMREMQGSGVDFVAVGAGHLLGDDGLVAQLRARGVTVERVPPQSH